MGKHEREDVYIAEKILNDLLNDDADYCLRTLLFIYHWGVAGSLSLSQTTRQSIFGIRREASSLNASYKRK